MTTAVEKKPRKATVKKIEGPGRPRFFDPETVNGKRNRAWINNFSKMGLRIDDMARLMDIDVRTIKSEMKLDTIFAGQIMENQVNAKQNLLGKMFLMAYDLKHPRSFDSIKYLMEKILKMTDDTIHVEHTFNLDLFINIVTRFVPAEKIPELTKALREADGEVIDVESEPMQ